MNSARYHLSRLRFAFATRKAAAHARISTNVVGPCVVSMVSGRDVANFVVALLSFCRWIAPSRVVVLNGGGLSARHRRAIQAIAPFVEFREKASVDMGSVQRGPIWERIALIAELCQSSYVVQIDSDTITLREPKEAIAAISRGDGFVMRGDVGGPGIEQISAAAERARSSGVRHPQLSAERALESLLPLGLSRYVRGCAAFTGFPQGSVSLALLESIDRTLRRECGDEWLIWGSEQVTSNVLVANSSNAVALHDLDYLSYFDLPNVRHEDAALVHFIGSFRYHGGHYTRLASDFVRRHREA